MKRKINIIITTRTGKWQAVWSDNWPTSEEHQNISFEFFVCHLQQAGWSSLFIFLKHFATAEEGEFKINFSFENQKIKKKFNRKFSCGLLLEMR